MKMQGIGVQGTGVQRGTCKVDGLLGPSPFWGVTKQHNTTPLYVVLVVLGSCCTMYTGSAATAGLLLLSYLCRLCPCC